MNCSEKHAYLIIAHKNDLTFYTLLSLLDDSRNDIYIHMDVKNTAYDPDSAVQAVKNSSVFQTKRTSVSWGAYSLVNAELLLLDAACKNGRYQYYHLLSGEDLPLKTPSEMYRFFEKNSGTEFVGLTTCSALHDRMCYRHFLQEKIGRHDKVTFFSLLERYSLAIQRCLHLEVNRNVHFEKGSQWFSITDPLARYVLENADWVEKTFRFALCPDESFLQTLAVRSPMRDNLCKAEEIAASARYIDWNRGEPYTFREEDFDLLKQSDRMFARKFSTSVDSEIIRHWSIYLHERISAENIDSN